MSYIKQLKIFVRVYELGNMSAAARDQRVSPAVASSRIAELENHLGVRLFNRTTRSLQATEQGRLFYDGANAVLAAIDAAEATVAEHTKSPRGSIFVAAPLGIGRRFIAPSVPKFKEEYPEIDVRLRLSDRNIDLTEEGLDIAFFLGVPEDSSHRIRSITECTRVLCASPEYLEKRGMPNNGDDLLKGKHDCLALRFPGQREFQWLLNTADGPKRFAVTGPFESDHGSILTDWALMGYGIINKPVFEVSEHLKTGALVPVAQETPPSSVFLGCLYPHKKHQDPKVRLFIDYMVANCKAELEKLA
ncbi:MAG: LysR family transcriptional regulator [Amylibacter sp.]|nr:LysR family transcriptional regulator [Amylibacter sp.]